MARDQLRVNILIHQTWVFVGVQATDCDPKITIFEGDLQAALDRIPGFIEEANRQWDVAPRNPKSTIPEPKAPEKPPRRHRKRLSLKVNAVKPKQATQKTLF